MEHSLSSQRCTASVVFPPHLLKLGLLTALVVDEGENIIFTDELNHTVVSLDKEGKLRWFKGDRGSKPGQFWYPKGVGFGRISTGVKSTPCFAIADSWNRRVQFLNLDGSFNTEWRLAGEVPFSEIADVRFVAGTPNGLSDGSYGCWCVLDRGNHRMWAFAQDGRLIFQIGRCVDPGTETRWRARAAANPASQQEIPGVDPMYYPTRLFGNSFESLFLSDSTPRTIKQVTPKDLIVVALESFGDREYIAADKVGFLEWSPSNGRLRFHNCRRDIRWEGAIGGRPVPSNLLSLEYWTQMEDRLLRWRLPIEPD